MLRADSRGMGEGDYVFITLNLHPSETLQKRWAAGASNDAEAQNAYFPLLQVWEREREREKGGRSTGKLDETERDWEKESSKRRHTVWRMTHAHTEREREREREGDPEDMRKLGETERDREKEISKM